MDSTFTIRPRGPFSWAATSDMAVNFPPVARHWRTAGPGPSTAGEAEADTGEAGVDTGGAGRVTVAFPLDGDFRPVAVGLRWAGGSLHGTVVGTDRVKAARDQVARMFSLDHDGSGYPAVGVRDAAIGGLMEQLPGLRPVCFSSPYEAAAWGVMSQRISMAQAARILDLLAEQHGTRLTVAGGEAVAFPTPQALLAVPQVEGLAAVKVDRLHGVARAALDGRLDPDQLRALGPEAAQAQLRTIPGIGPFWASGVYLRGCGIVDEFPEEPLSVAALGQLHGLGDRPDPGTVARLTDVYRPYRMWVAVLLRVAAARGVIPGIGGREGRIRAAAR